MITAYLQKFNIFSQDEINNIVSFFSVEKLKKNDYFVMEGDKCEHIAFIESGIFRSYYTSEQGKESTYCFRFPNDLLASYTSFVTDRAGTENIQAVTSSVVHIIEKHRIEEMAAGNHNWALFLKIIAEQEYIELEKRFFQLQRENAAFRYQSLLRDQPHYIQKIPLQYLASYLGITQRHLSRLRKESLF